MPTNIFEEEPQREEQTPIEIVRQRLSAVIGQSALVVEEAIQRCKEDFGFTKGALNSEYKTLCAAAGGSDDLSYTLSKDVMKNDFSDGKHIMMLQDKAFWTYNGKSWHSRKKHSIKAVVAERLQNMDLDGDDLDGNFSKTMNAALDVLGALTNRDDDPLGFLRPPPNVLCLANGELNLDTDEFTDHKPESYLKNEMNVEYVEGAEAPVFEKLVLDVCCGDEDMARHVKEQMAYCVSPRKPFAAFFLWIGEGSNGKTTLTRVIQELMGRTCWNAAIDSLFSSRFAMNSILGCSAVIDDDYSDDNGRVAFPMGGIKKLTEKKVLSGEVKGGETFAFLSELVALILSNNWPFAPETSYGAARRSNVVVFERMFLLPRDYQIAQRERAQEGGEHIWVDDNNVVHGLDLGDDSEFIPTNKLPMLADNTMEQQLLQELPGILNSLLRSLAVVVERGGFKEPEACTEAREEWVLRGNSIAYFIHEVCERVNESVPLATFKAEYRMFCERAGIRPVGDRKITEQIERAGHSVTPTNGVAQVRRLRINAVL